MSRHKPSIKAALCSFTFLLAVSSFYVTSNTSRVLAIPDCNVENPPPICNEPRPPRPKPPEPEGTEVRIPAAIVEELARRLNTAIQGSQIHLNNYGQSDSYIKLSQVLGGGEHRFDIPVLVKDIPGPFGKAKFYVQDWNLNRLELKWQSPDFKLSLFFESNGREIKGFHSSKGDDFIPDLQIDNARLDVYLKPVAANGTLTYAVSRTEFNANIQATGGCSIPIIGNVCNVLTDYKDKIKSEVETQVRQQLNNTTLRSLVGEYVKSTVFDRLGLGNIRITLVTVVGNDVVIRYVKN